MKLYRLAAYCGPCSVQAAAKRLRGMGFNVVLEGTGHVYLHAPGENAFNASNNLARELQNQGVNWLDIRPDNYNPVSSEAA